jgi:hypothetical protein
MSKFKNFILTTIIFGILISIIMIIFVYFLYNELSYQIWLFISIIGISSGLLFSLLLLVFSLIIEKKINIDLENNEKIIYQGLANHFKGVESVGGKLFLTNKNKKEKYILNNRNEWFEKIQTHLLK